MGNMGEWIGVFLIVAVLFGWGGFGGGRESVREAVDAQSTATGIRDVLLSSANNNYETSMLISQQNLINQQQNSTNQLAVINGFNAIQASLAGLSSQLGTCCCDIKTQLLQDKYDSALRELAKAQTDASLAAQSAYLLSTMGKWVANPAAVAI